MPLSVRLNWQKVAGSSGVKSSLCVILVGRAPVKRLASAPKLLSGYAWSSNHQPR
ncbi:hypothetical protein O9992_13255 [Vibrio lentus]|nr:hypothetical protein [Vibrio lentus]